MTLTDADVTIVRALCAALPRLTVLNAEVSPAKTFVRVRIHVYPYDAQSLVENLYRAMNRGGGAYYGVSWSALPGQTVEELTFTRIR